MEQSPTSIFRIIPKHNTRFEMRNSKENPHDKTNHEYFKNSVKNWNAFGCSCI